MFFLQSVLASALRSSPASVGITAFLARSWCWVVEVWADSDFWGLVVERGEFGWLGGGDLGRLLDLFIFIFLGEGRIGCGMLVSGN